MKIYQQELLRKLQPLGCSGNYDADSGKLNVQYEGILLCKQDENGYLTYDSRIFTPALCDKLEEIKDQAAAIREYVDIYENAPPMKIDSLKGYRRFAEYGDTVLGGKYSEKYGAEKGRIVYFAVIGIICGVSVVLQQSNTVLDLSAAFNAKWVLPAVCTASAALYAASWLLSIAFYKKREL